MTSRKKLEIGSIFPYFVPPAGTPPSLFRLFANATNKINHARRNFTFTCKITPRVNFYMFRTLDDFNDQPFHATGIGAILIFEGQISSKRIQPTGFWMIHFIEALFCDCSCVPLFRIIAWLFHVMKNYPKSLHELTRRKSWEKSSYLQMPCLYQLQLAQLATKTDSVKYWWECCNNSLYV